MTPLTSLPHSMRQLDHFSTTTTLVEPVTIVMYHYVRELSRSRFRQVKGLDLTHFREQLGYIRRHYTVVSAETLIAAVRHRDSGGKWELPHNACMLTFDDGYTDHFRSVFPLLDDLKVPGSFFPPVRAVCDRQVLDVNKIHFILASAPDLRLAIDDIFRMLNRFRDEYDLPSNEALYQQYARPSRYETAGVVFFKRLLQVVLPASLRALILSHLFAKYVTADESAFATELYVGIDELRCMTRHGMYVGSHADTHPWLEQLSPTQQADEIDRFAGVSAHNWHAARCMDHVLPVWQRERVVTRAAARSVVRYRTDHACRHRISE